MCEKGAAGQGNAGPPLSQCRWLPGCDAFASRRHTEPTNDGVAQAMRWALVGEMGFLPPPAGASAAAVYPAEPHSGGAAFLICLHWDEKMQQKALGRGSTAVSCGTRTAPLLAHPRPAHGKLTAVNRTAFCSRPQLSPTHWLPGTLPSNRCKHHCAVALEHLAECVPPWHCRPFANLPRAHRPRPLHGGDQ